MKIEYTEDFKERVMAVYPDWNELHKKLDEGSIMVGRYLSDSFGNGISTKRVMEATNLEELKAVARVELRKLELYQEWCEKYDNRNYGY